ncbi:MAG: adenylate/guanylate cyclase domain-containing protein [Alphaproteobacteria bacterium]|nr:adenylate/guanylate cyclase domain-containing protein [Alphaproteobacteria bacterium]
MMRVGLQRQIRLVLGFALAGAAIGVLYVVINFPLRLDGLLRGAVTGFLISGGIVAWEVVARTSRLGAPLYRLAFVPFILVKSLVWGAWIVGVLLVTRLALPIPGVPLFRDLVPDIVFALASSLGVVLLREFDRLLGPGTVWRLVTGRYHTPRVEDRAFLLLDIVGSTAIAERIGPARFLALLDFLIGELTPVLAAHRAEIYRYVGDAIIVTWPLETAIAEARCVRCSAAVGARLAAIQPECRRRFGLEVQGRAALHAGPVAIGEIGELKREITMLGDTLNTASKIEKIAGEFGKRAVISRDLLDRLRLPEGMTALPLGEVDVPGRSQRMELFSLQSLQ